MLNLAPCGHTGIPIIGTFVLCPKCDTKSDGVPLHKEEEKTQPIVRTMACAWCGGTAKITLTRTIKLVYGPSATTQATDWKCDSCKRTWTVYAPPSTP